MALSATYLGDNQFSTTSTLTLAVTTTSSAGRIVVAVSSESNSATPALVSSISGLSVIWTKRAAATHSAARGQSTEEWYADVLSSWTSGTITVTMNRNVDDGNIHAAHVHSSIGAPISWDANGSLPGTFVSPAGTTAELSLSSNSTAPFVLLHSGNGGSTVLPSGPTQAGFVRLGFRQNVGGVNEQGSTMWGGTSSIQLSSTATGFMVAPGGPDTSYVFDALQEIVANTGNMFLVMGP